jgi:uncharacterized protein DUF1572
MIDQQYLDDAMVQLKKLKAQADKALAQTNDDHLFTTLDPESNSIAIIMKHIAGNMRSRWTDFLTTDGEKPDRDRDREFVDEPDTTRAAILARWEDSWSLLFHSLSSLTGDDLGRTVSVRGEPHSVVQAINRQMTHYAAHVGQILLLAKHHAGRNWQTLSIPKGKSKEFEVAKTGARYKFEPPAT